MANNCWYEIHVKGRREDCETFLERMQGNEVNNFNFCRIFSVYSTISGADDGEYVLILAGDCAWSLESCCRSSGYAGIDLFEANTRELSLQMEAYAEETGVGFMEHYIYDNGACVEDECADYHEWFWDRGCYETYEEFIASLGYSKEDCEARGVPKEDEFDSEGYCRIGGMEWDFSF